MKKPRADRFDPNKSVREIQPEDVDLSGVPAIQPRENVEDGGPPSGATPAAQTVRTEERTPEQTNGRRDEPTAEETNIRTSEQTNARPKERTKTRHSFDVFEDQLLSLKEIQLEREKEIGENVLLGELVQEALDLLIAEERMNETTI